MLQASAVPMTERIDSDRPQRRLAAPRFRKCTIGSKSVAACAREMRSGAAGEKIITLLDLCVSSLRRGHANLLCIVPILTDDPRRESKRLIRTGESPLWNCSWRCQLVSSRRRRMHNLARHVSGREREAAWILQRILVTLRCPTTQAEMCMWLDRLAASLPSIFRHRDSNPGRSGEGRVS